MGLLVASWAILMHLGPVFGLFWAVLGLSWAISGVSWACLGPSWAVLDSFGPQKLKKPKAFFMVFANAGGRHFEALDGLSCAFLGCLGPVLGLSWACHGPSWACLGASWACLGPSWGILGQGLGARVWDPRLVLLDRDLL